MEEQQTQELFLACNGVDPFVVDDLLDFSNDGDVDGEADAAALDAVADSSSAVAESCNSSGCEPSFADAAEFSGDLCVPCEDLAELEWLSNFVEESFTSEEQDKFHLLSGFKTPQPNPSTQTRPGPGPAPEPVISPNNDKRNDDVPVPARARSKRSRAAAAASTWASAALLAGDIPADPYSTPLSGRIADVSSGHIADVSNSEGKPREKVPSAAYGDGGVRRCQHCATEKTPQWRTGPMGPKTLCNACGVRYKSGRLVPEYRPAASPTFVLTKHSNSHRKVMELRRQKETVVSRRREMDQEGLLSQLRRERVLMGDVRSNGDDFLIHHHVGPDFRQLI